MIQRVLLFDQAWDGPTIFAAIVGSIGLLVSGLSFGWQILRWRRSRQTVVRVSMFRFPSIGVPDAKPNSEALIISALNESDHNVRVISVGLDYTDAPGDNKKGTFFWPPPEGATLPGVIEPKDAGYTARGFRDEDRHYFLAGTRLRAYVTTANAMRFESNWVLSSEIPLTLDVGRAIPIPPEFRESDGD